MTWMNLSRSTAYSTLLSLLDRQANKAHSHLLKQALDTQGFNKKQFTGTLGFHSGFRISLIHPIKYQLSAHLNLRTRSRFYAGIKWSSLLLLAFSIFLPSPLQLPLQRVFENCQILIFTCHKHKAQLGDGEGSRQKYINLATPLLM